MASIVGKRRGNQTYYYLVESARVNGNPRIVSQQYLGSAQEVAARLSGKAVQVPQRSLHKQFGDLAAVWSTLQRLDLITIVDDVVPRQAKTGVSVGTYMALACAKHIVDTRSERSLADWWDTTAAPRWVRAERSALSQRRFWDAMDGVSAEQLRDIQTRLARGMAESFGLDLNALALNMSDFANFVELGNSSSTTQRGRAKQKRNVLQPIGLALVVTRDGEVPVLTHPYHADHSGNIAATAVETLTVHYRDLANDAGAVTAIYDTGQMGDYHDRIDEHGSGIIGCLPPNDYPRLLAIPVSDYQRIVDDHAPGISYLDATVTVQGRARRAIVTYSESLHANQSRDLDQRLATAGRRLAELQSRLASSRCRRTRAAVEAEVAAIRKPRWVADIITASLTDSEPGETRLNWRSVAGVREQLETRLFGKRILFTNRDWPAPDIVAASLCQIDIESGYRQLNNPYTVASAAQCWTDAKIRARVFYSVLALAVVQLMRRDAARSGLYLSSRELLDRLAGIEETVLLYHEGGQGRCRVRRILTDMDATQQQLAGLFDIQQYAPKS